MTLNPGSKARQAKTRTDSLENLRNMICGTNLRFVEWKDDWISEWMTTQEANSETVLWNSWDMKPDCQKPAEVENWEACAQLPVWEFTMVLLRICLSATYWRALTGQLLLELEIGHLDPQGDGARMGARLSPDDLLPQEPDNAWSFQGLVKKTYEVWKRQKRFLDALSEEDWVSSNDKLILRGVCSSLPLTDFITL